MKECCLNDYVISDKQESFCGTNRSPLKVIERFQTVINVDNIDTNLNFHVVPNCTMSYNCLLGRDSLCNIKSRVIIERDSIKLENNDNVYCENNIMLINYDSRNDEIELKTYTKVPHSVKAKLNEIYADSYTRKFKEDPIPRFEMNIYFKNQSPPVCVKPKRLSFFEKGKLQEIPDSLLQEGVI